MYEKNNDINRRVFFVGGGMIILSSFLLSRLWKLQVSEQDKYLLLSDKNRIRITPLFPKRGIFYDRNGNELALNSDRIYQIEIFDLSGNKVMEFKGNSINVDHLPSATYIVNTIDLETKASLSYKIIKK